MKKVGFFTLGAIIGGLLAGIAVLLLTPMSGNDLRQEIKVQSDKLINDVKQASFDRQEELKAELENLRLGKVIKLEAAE
ncbi:MAG: YtxH domain-containing protein [Anaerolineae bacterium]|jgi:gas vesicle protein|nr:YtxH domain-containing protein [Anaerolineae bacterium]